MCIHMQAGRRALELAKEDATFEALKARGILVKNMGKAHPMLRNCLRLSVGTAEENHALLTALAATGLP